MSELRLGAGTDALTQADLPQDWHAHQLSDFCSFSQGGRLGLTKQEHYRSSGIPAYSAAGQDGFVDFAEFRDIDAVVLSAIGANCGRCFLAQGDWTTLANVQVIIPDAALADARFVHYRVNRDDYWPRSGSAQPFIKPSDMKACWIALPPVEQQKKIAQILDTLDTAIRETKALIDKLKAVKQGLLHDLLTRGIDANGQLRPQQSEAPQLYKESPLGWIPSEWEVRPSESVCEAVIDCKNRTPPILESGHPVVRTPNVRDGRFVYTELVHTDEASYKIWTQRGRPRPGDVLITREAPVGEVCLVPADMQAACLGQRMMMYQPDPTMLRSEFMLIALMSQPVQRILIDKAGGSTVGHVRVGDIRLLTVPVPSLREQDLIVDQYQAAVDRLSAEESTLVKFRDSKAGLMDDLLTGRVRVTPLLESVQQLAAQTGA